jgi:transcriptional regulator with GAF, ATPase, and Fis domain
MHARTTASDAVETVAERTAVDEGRDEAVTPVYAQVVDELVGVVVDVPTMQDLLGQLIDITQRATDGTTAISVTSFEDGAYDTAASTGPAARHVDEHEYGAGAGPCIDAIESGTRQITTDVLAEARWPGFSEVAADNGFRSVAGVPLIAGRRTVGAINLYAAEPDGLGDVLSLAERLASPLATVVANGLALQRMSRLGDHLQDELDRLATVEQAVGVLMAQRTCDGATAQETLRRTARATGRTVDDVAAQLVEHTRAAPRST